MTLYPIQYRSEVEISGSSEIVVAGSCLQHGLVQAQIGHDLLELAVFFLQLAQAAQLGRTDAAVTLLPDVEAPR